MSGRSPGDLQRPDWNDLEKNYELHDIGQQHLCWELEALGYEVEPWGIDKRGHDESLIYDDKMDLKVRDPDRLGGRLQAIEEIKTKRRENWYGVMNLRHFRHYVDVAHEFEVPVFVYMTKIDDGTDDDGERGQVDADSAVIEKDTFLPIKPWDEYQAALDGEYEHYEDAPDEFLDDQALKHPQVEYTWRAPDGNQVVQLDLDTGIDWTEMGWRVDEGEIEWASGTGRYGEGKPWRGN